MKSYLTEEKLLNEISLLIDEQIIHNKKFLNYRPDIRIESMKLIIEFDGYLHYTNSNTCMKDLQKDIDYVNAGYRIIRIPYFIQWCSEISSFVINKNVVCTQVYPHGFIDSKAILPADFCWLGLQRFLRDLELYKFAKNDIIQSLKNNTKNINLVLPEPIQFLLNTSKE